MIEIPIWAILTCEHRLWSLATCLRIIPILTCECALWKSWTCFRILPIEVHIEAHISTNRKHCTKHISTNRKNRTKVTLVITHLSPWCHTMNIRYHLVTFLSILVFCQTKDFHSHQVLYQGAMRLMRWNQYLREWEVFWTSTLFRKVIVVIVFMRSYDSIHNFMCSILLHSFVISTQFLIHLYLFHFFKIWKNVDDKRKQAAKVCEKKRSRIHSTDEIG